MVEKTSQHDTPVKISEILKSAYKRKPEYLIMKETKWNYLMWVVLKGKNILLRGHSGCGKTLAAVALADAFPDRKFFRFNMGDTQDPKAFLIGNTRFNSEKGGTYFVASEFLTAIQIPKAIILLDELSRIHPDGENILLTILDEVQRYVRVDEGIIGEVGNPIIKVAEGVCFIATANVGNEYTATRLIDRATNDRFKKIEVDLLSQKEEELLLKMNFKDLNPTIAKIIANVVDRSRSLYNESEIETIISTRMAQETAELIVDGFSFRQAADITIYPEYENDGLVSSRVKIKQVIEKENDMYNDYTPPVKDKKKKGVFNPETVLDAADQSTSSFTGVKPFT